MSKQFERWSRNSEAMIVGAVVVILAVAYVVSRLTGG
jgi:hypothetical protein